jgi:hypothetical protein
MTTLSYSFYILVDPEEGGKPFARRPPKGDASERAKAFLTRDSDAITHGHGCIYALSFD